MRICLKWNHCRIYNKKKKDSKKKIFWFEQTWTERGRHICFTWNIYACFFAMQKKFFLINQKEENSYTQKEEELSALIFSFRKNQKTNGERVPLWYFMNAVALRSVSGSFQHPLTEVFHPPLSVPCTWNGGNAYLRSKSKKYSNCSEPNVI